MNDLDRVLKGYTPKSSKKRYWVLWFFLNLLMILKIKFFRR